MPYPKKRGPNIRSKIYHKYKYHLFPKINHLRGTTRLLKILEKSAERGIEKIDKSEIEPIYEKQWDNLAILDAARYDTYQETINTNAESRITVESHSKGFIRETFSQGDWSDTVIITANPFYNEREFKELVGKKPEDVFATIFQTWKTDWNSQNGTVMPEKIIEDVKTAEKLFPDKRKIIHFMQPHHPFIQSDIDDPGFGDTKENEKDYEKVWELAAREKIDHNEVIQGYLSNHELMLDPISELEEVLEGSIKITADHGNLLGENGLYGHPGSSNLKPLRKVPFDSL